MSSRFFPGILFCILIFTGCAPVTQNQMAAKGSSPLDAQQIFNLVSGNTLYLETIDFKSHLYFLADGTLKARAESRSGSDKDTGGWDINEKNQLCLKFKTWYYGEMKCYSVYPKTGQDAYVLFHANGAIAFSAQSLTGDSARLYTPPQSNRQEIYLRESLATGQTPSSPAPASAPQPAVEPSGKTTYLRESLAAGGQDLPAPQETGPDLTSNEEVQQTVKTMAKNCPGCNLDKSDLRQADLVGANLKGAKLKGADLSGANLRRANLEGANLSGAKLVSANLPGANLKGATLSGADFTGANLIQADFTGAKTENMILTNANLEGAKGLK